VIPDADFMNVIVLWNVNRFDHHSADAWQSTTILLLGFFNHGGAFFFGGSLPSFGYR